MAYTPSRAKRESRKWELEEGTRRAMTNSKMSYATGYLLRIGKDAVFDSPMRGSHSLATRPSGSPLPDRTASPIRLKFGRRSPTPPLQDLCWSDGWEDHSENNQHDTASVVAALAKSRKRKTALTHSLVGDENVQLLTEGVDQPSSKRRKQEVEQEEEEGGIGCNHTRGSAFLPVTQSAQMDVATQNSDTLPSVSASHSESSSVMVEDHTELSIHATGLQHTVPSWHKLSTPPVTQWKKLTLPSNLREEERSTETVAVNHGDQGSKSLPSGSLSESKHARKEDGAASIRTNTIRLPEILIDTDSVSSTDEQSSTYTSRASTPTLDSSLQPSPISPNPKQQLLMRLRQRYTSGLSPAPVESWDRVKSRLLNKEDEPGPAPSVKRQISREDVKKDNVRALSRVRSYLRQFSEEEQQQQKAEEDRKKKEDNARPSSLATVAVTSSQPATSAPPATTASIAGLGIALSQPTLAESGLKLPGLSLPAVGGGGGLSSSDGGTGTDVNHAVPPLGASSQLGTTSLKLEETAAMSASTGLPAPTVGVGLSQPKVSDNAGGTSSLPLNPLQSSLLLGNFGASTSQPLSGIKFDFSSPSTSAPVAGSLQLGGTQNTTTVRAPTLPALATQSSSGLNLQFNSAVGTGSQPLQSTTAASGGPTLLSSVTAAGQSLKGASNSVLGSGIQLPQLGTAAQMSTGLGQGGIFPPAASTASFSTPAAPLSLTATGGLFSQLGQTSVSSSTTNPTGSLFGPSSSTGFLGLQQSSGQTLASQPQSSLFNTPIQGGATSQALGLSLFGGSQQVSSGIQGSIQPLGGGIFGGVQSAQTSLFGNSNQGDRSQGLFDSSKVVQPGSILGTNQTLGINGGQGIQQNTALLGGSGAQPSTSSVFGAQSNPAPLSTSIFGNVKPSTGASGPLPFNGSSLSDAVLGTPPSFSFAAQSASANSTLSQLGNHTGNTSFKQPAQGLTFSATPQINFNASGFNTPLGGNTASQTPASGRRPIARATRRSRRN